MSFNKVFVVGNLGVDPVLRYTANGIAVCNFSLASNQKKKDKDGNMQDITTWFRIVLWRVQAENAAKYLVKGQQVFIEGTLQVEEWNDKQNVPRYTLEIQATDMQFLGGNKPEGTSEPTTQESSQAPAPQPAQAAAASVAAKSDDDIPF